MLLNSEAEMIQQASFYSFGKIECWLTFARLPRQMFYYEYNCPSSPFYEKHVRKVEAQFSNICQDFVKYRNTPHKDASAERYFPDYLELLKIKKRWDPNFLLGPATGSLQDLRGRAEEHFKGDSEEHFKEHFKGDSEEHFKSDSEEHFKGDSVLQSGF